jgi:hypothetical protein
MWDLILGAEDDVREIMSFLSEKGEQRTGK